MIKCKFSPFRVADLFKNQNTQYKYQENLQNMTEIPGEHKS